MNARVAAPARVLLVDDQADLLRAYGRALSAAGNSVESAPDGEAAVELLKTSEYDVVVSDIGMPRLDGLALLREVRALNLDLPVVLMTGEPSVTSASRAIEHGALRYLVKPVDLGELARVVEYAARLYRMARVRREAFDALDHVGLRVGDRAGLEVRFADALSNLWMAHQPIVSWQVKKVVAFAELLRSDETSMPDPGALLDAAERLDRIHALGRTIRQRVAGGARLAPEATQVFVNLHARDLLDEQLYEPTAPLSRIAERVVLEITERAPLDDVKDLRRRIAALRELGFRIALDDLGAGYAGLTTFAQLEPEIVKLDMSLIRGLDREPSKRKIVTSMTGLCRELGATVVAEGIETEAERDEAIACGCDLLQGFLFAKPSRRHAPVAFPR